MDWIRYQIQKNRKPEKIPETVSQNPSHNSPIEPEKIIEIETSSYHLPYRSDELDFIFERKRDSFFARTFYPAIAGIGFFYCRNLRPFRFWYREYRRFAWIAGVSTVYKFSSYNLHANLLQQNFYYHELSPGNQKT